jgi:hypothetical protein
MDLTQPILLLQELSAVFSDEGAKTTLSLTGVLVGVSFGILSFFPKLIEYPYTESGELIAKISARNQQFASLMRRVRRTTLLLLSGNVLLWVSNLIKQAPWEQSNKTVALVLVFVSITGGILTIVGLGCFFYAIARYPINELATWTNQQGNH